MIDEVTEAVKHEIKKKDGFIAALLAPSAASLVQPVTSSVVKVLLEGKSWEQEENIIITWI